MDLNLMGIEAYQQFSFSIMEVVFLATPFLISGGALIAQFIPELAFFAECQNVPGGDVCSIRLG